MKHAPIDWDAVELLPRRTCAVCGRTTQPWGLVRGNRYVCSKRCCLQSRR